MVCWGPNEVALLRDLTPGQTLDNFPKHMRPQVVVDWKRAVSMERLVRLSEQQARTALTNTFDPMAELVGA
ncbi:hypothetical protein [Actinophytocola oryzae]|uniref:Uncharacterized protein n=1 Tax=Actinophytocola oryzae TaxID=502181 RepID=A0A4R7VDX5_9PSEU|nr:hypothetical protein [Actinophytocola oryzae]TDV47199.1 hypothetical protein CLV71_110383 [Actinophytocola oryzae]